MNKNLSFGSVCSGIEASQLAFAPIGFEQIWSSEIADFPSKVLSHYYPNIPNIGDMLTIPNLIRNEEIEAPDVFCGGTPCQAFSLAGWKNGLTDERGQLTMTFIEIADALDEIRHKKNKGNSIVLWENVEGVLNDRTNAFGNFIAGLAGYETEIAVNKWSKSGYLEGPKRNVAWRVLDAKYFGLPQQRKRLFVLAGGKSFRPDSVLFEADTRNIKNEIKRQTSPRANGNDLFSGLINESQQENENVFYKDGVKFQVFREYTDCLYSAYATKWNGNAAAYNGSLYVAQNDRIRRFIPHECEGLMGFPKGYTDINGQTDTNRYHAIGNSWAVPVVYWIGERIKSLLDGEKGLLNLRWSSFTKITPNNHGADLYLLNGVHRISPNSFLNTSEIPNTPEYGNLRDIVQAEDVPEKFYLSPKACKGILRRKEERNLNMNPELEQLLARISGEDQE